MTERNEIAKIIDPEAWERWGKERGGIGFACWPTERQREAAFLKADEIIAPSLAKAESIMGRRSSDSTAEPVSYRWRAPGGKHWTYDPSPEWVDDHKHEIELEALPRSFPPPAKESLPMAQPTDIAVLEALTVTSDGEMKAKPLDAQLTGVLILMRETGERHAREISRIERDLAHWKDLAERYRAMATAR